MQVFYEIDYILRAKLCHIHLCISNDSQTSGFPDWTDVSAINQGMK